MSGCDCKCRPALFGTYVGRRVRKVRILQELYYSLNPRHTSVQPGEVAFGLNAARWISEKAVCSCILPDSAFSSLLPPSWDRLGRFGLASFGALSTGWPGLVWPVPTILCTVQASCVSRSLPTAVQRPTGPDRQCPHHCRSLAASPSCMGECSQQVSAE